MRYRHNKKRNTAFLFEATVRELTKSIVEKDNEKRSKILNILKEYFGKNSTLFKEYELYKALEAGQSLEPRMAEKMINEVKKIHSSLNSKEIFVEQSKFIKKINYLFFFQISNKPKLIKLYKDQKEFEMT